MRIDIDNQNKTTKYQTSDIFPSQIADNQGIVLNKNQKLYSFDWKIYLFKFISFLIGFHLFCKTIQLTTNITQRSLIQNSHRKILQLDFCGPFTFALCQGIVLIITGIATLQNSRINLIVVNIGGTLIALIIFWKNPENPILSYWIKYIIQLLLTLTNFLYISHCSFQKSLIQRYKWQVMLIIRIASKLAIFKLLIYGQAIPNSNPESLANDIEYFGELINDIILLGFINLLKAQKRIESLKIFQCQFNEIKELLDKRII